MRKQYHFSNSNNNTPETLLNGTLLWKKKDFLHQDHTSLPSSSTSFQFSECTFANCYSETTGGAISLSNSGASLSVDHSTFTGCNVPTSSDGNYGGAIYCTLCKSVTISSSSFVSCKSVKGGGIYLQEICQFSSVDDSLFTQCSALGWGNGVVLWKLPQRNSGNTNSANTPLPASSNCRFLYNEYRVGTSGALYFCPVNGAHTLRENLYSYNNANVYGGAVECNLGGSYSVTTAVFHFSFFSNNNGNGNGDDVIILNNKYSASSPFLHCFSTEESSTRLTSYQDSQYPHDINWLPQTNANIKVIHPITTTDEISNHTNRYENDN